MEKRIKQSERKSIKVVVCGPESSGKSTLTIALADYYNTSYSEEFLRGFADGIYSNGEVLKYDDNLKIVEGQLELENIAFSNSEKLYFCDTDLLQTIIYSQVYYNLVQDELIASFLMSKGDVYLLLKPDIEWEYDVLRDQTKDREVIYKMLKDKLDYYKIRYHEIEGIGDKRLLSSVKKLDKIIV